MEQSEIIESLRYLVAKQGIKLASIESKLGMPRNNLSGIMRGKREIPNKWVEPLENYILNSNKKTITLVEDKDGIWNFEGKRCKLVWVENDYIKQTSNPVPEEKINESKAYNIQDLEKQIKEDISNRGNQSYFQDTPQTFQEPIDKFTFHSERISNGSTADEIKDAFYESQKEKFLNNKQKKSLEDLTKQILEKKGFIYND